MLRKKLKQCLSFFLAMVMAFSLVPVQAFATEGEHNHEGETEEITQRSEVVPAEAQEHEHSYTATVTPPDCVHGGYTTYSCECGDSYIGDEVAATGIHVYEAVGSENVITYTCTVCGDSYTEELPQSPEEIPTETPAEQDGTIQSRINWVLNTCGITGGMSDGEIADAVYALNDDTFEAVLDEILAIEEDAEYLTEEEFYALENRETFGRLIEVLNSNDAAAYASTTVSVLDGQVTVTDTSGNGSVSGNTVTVEATGSLFSEGKNTITITNKSSNRAILQAR